MGVHSDESRPLSIQPSPLFLVASESEAFRTLRCAKIRLESAPAAESKGGRGIRVFDPGIYCRGDVNAWPYY